MLQTSQTSLPGYGSRAVVHLKLCQESCSSAHSRRRVHTHPGRPQTTLDAKYNKHYNRAEQPEP